MGYKLDVNTGKYVYVPESKSSNSEKTKVVKNNPASTSDEIKGTTDNLTEENASDVFGRGKAKGNFRIRKHGKVNIVGVGKSFEGSYFVSEVTHVVSANGYEVDFSIKTKQEYIGKKSDSDKDVSKADEKTQYTTSKKPDKPSKKSGGYKLDPVTGKFTKV